MKKIKLSSRELFLILFIIFFAFISIFALFALKQNKTSQQEISLFNNGVASKYTNVVNSDEEEFLIFLQDNISNEFVVIPAMDYILRECFPKYSESGQTHLYSLYYDDVHRFSVLYQDIIDIEEYTYYLTNFMDQDEYKDKDINDAAVYKNIDLTSLRVVIEELRNSHFKLYRNGDYFEVFFDFDWFYDEYKDILNQDFVDYVRLEALSLNPEIAPNRDSIDLTILQQMIIECVDYLDSHDNEGLNFYVVEMLRNALQLYLGGDTSYAFYEDMENFSVSAEMIDNYTKFIEKNTDKNFADLLNDCLIEIKDNEGKGYPLTEIIKPLIDNFLIEEGYATEKQIETISKLFDLQVDTSYLENPDIVEETLE